MKRIIYYITLLAIVLLSACSENETVDNEQTLPEGMGRIRISICSPENSSTQTRNVGNPAWEDPDHNWEKLQSVRIIICKAANGMMKLA